jgi:4-hydroxy-tetrahydrodipicolinate synthase
MTVLEGAFTALVTPFSADDRVDTAALSRIVRQQLDGGIDGLVPLGTTGEAGALTAEEQQAVVETVLGLAKGKVPVIVGSGSNSTRIAVTQTQRAMSWGADAALVVCPYYNKPTQEGMFQHFKAIHEQTGAPIIAYNVPSRTSSDLLPETVARLVEARAIVAVKDATANMQRAVETLALIDPRAPFSLLSGDDFTILPMVACGGRGVISVVSNLVPRDTAELVRATAAGRFDVARRLQRKLIDLSRPLFAVSSPIPVKAGMSLLGFGSPAMRLPLVAADDRTTASVRAAMQAYGGLLG